MVEMKIILPHTLTTIKHFGYRGFMGTNPNIQIVDNINDADYVWYHTAGDSNNLQEDLYNISHLNKSLIAVITGDETPSFFPYGYVFGTTCGFNIPYEYDRFIPYYIQGCWDWHKRTITASFRGHRTTWKNRFKMDVKGAKITWIDWWRTPPEAKGKMMSDYMLELQQSVFSLCPRGNGPSSMRLMESMLMGAIPVRFDDWTKPFGQRLDFSPRFNLDTDNMNDIISFCRNMSANEINERRKAMRDFVENYLVIDVRNKCEGTMGYSEYIRKLVR